MQVVDVNNLQAKGQITELIGKIDQPNTKEQINYWLTFNLGTDVFGAWIGFENDVPVGLITAELIPEGVFIAFNYMKPATKGNGELLAQVENWAKEKDIHKLVFFTKRSPKTFMKKYGFSIVRSILEKEI